MAVDLAFTPERVRELREHMGLTGAEFAKRVGVSGAAVSLWESGARKPTDVAVLQRLLELEREAAGAR